MLEHDDGRITHDGYVKKVELEVAVRPRLVSKRKEQQMAQVVTTFGRNKLAQQIAHVQFRGWKTV